MTAGLDPFDRSWLDALPDYVFCHDDEGRCVYANPAAAEAVRTFLGVEPSELIGRSWRDLDLPPELSEATRALDACRRTVARTGEPMRTEIAFPLPGGVRYVDYSLGCVRRSHRTLIVAVARDVTSQRESAAARDALAAIIESSGDAVITHDLNGTILSWNPGAEAMYGYTAEEAIGRSLSILSPPETDVEMADILAGVRAGVRVEGYETERVRRDGSRVLISLTVSPIYDGRGRIVGASRLHRDISERRRSEERYRSLLDAAPDAVVCVDEDGSIAIVNTQTERLFGYRREELIGQPVEVLVPEASRGRHSAFRAAYFADPSYRPMGAGLDLTARRKDGTQFPAEISLSALETGGRLLVSGAIRDVTDRREVEAALRAAREEAERANREKSEFLSRVSHELRTPLNAILGFGQILELDGVRPDHEEPVKLILRAGRHLLELVDEMLDISRVEAGRLTFSIEPVELRPVVGEIVSLILPAASSHKITVRVETEPGLFVLADRQRLRQILLNLASNAVKYNRPGGDVVISSHETADGNVRVEVCDSGIGIPEEFMSRLFTPFDRLGAGSSDIEGTGLGLALCERLVDAMGGRIHADSKVGEGSTFWFEFPRGTPPSDGAPAAAGVPAFAETTGTSRTAVLYVEDNVSNLRLVEQILLRRPNVQLLAAYQGGLGLELAREHRPGLILLDLHLPDMPGEEVLRRLQAYPTTRDIPVIVISADATANRVERLRAAGATEYLTKPLDVGRFLFAVDSLLAAPR